MKAAPLTQKPSFPLMKQGDIQNVYHLQMPRWLFTDPRYMGLTLETKVAYRTAIQCEAETLSIQFHRQKALLRFRFNGEALMPEIAGQLLKIPVFSSAFILILLAYQSNKLQLFTLKKPAPFLIQPLFKTGAGHFKEFCRPVCYEEVTLAFSLEKQKGRRSVQPC